MVLGVQSREKGLHKIRESSALVLLLRLPQGQASRGVKGRKVIRASDFAWPLEENMNSKNVSSGNGSKP